MPRRRGAGARAALAIEQGAGYIEPDPVATKDGHLLARHEPSIGGTTRSASSSTRGTSTWTGAGTSLRPYDWTVSGNPELTSRTYGFLVTNAVLDKIGEYADIAATWTFRNEAPPAGGRLRQRAKGGVQALLRPRIDGLFSYFDHCGHRAGRVLRRLKAHGVPSHPRRPRLRSSA